MSGGGSSNPSGGPIDNQQRLQTSPNPSLPPADYSMGYARNFQTPSFFNPFSGYYGANQSYGGGFAQPYGGFGGFGQQFGGFQQPQYGGFEQPQFGGFGGFGGGFQQPQYGGFQQPQYGGGFSQPSFRNPFGRGFNPRTMPPQMQPQPMSPADNLYTTMPVRDYQRPREQPPYDPPTIPNREPSSGFNPMMGGLGGFGRFGGFQQQRDPNQPPPGMKLNPTYDSGYAMAMDMPMRGSAEALRKQRFIPV